MADSKPPLNLCGICATHEAREKRSAIPNRPENGMMHRCSAPSQCEHVNDYCMIPKTVVRKTMQIAFGNAMRQAEGESGAGQPAPDNTGLVSTLSARIDELAEVVKGKADTGHRHFAWQVDGLESIRARVDTIESRSSAQMQGVIRPGVTQVCECAGNGPAPHVWKPPSVNGICPGGGPVYKP